MLSMKAKYGLKATVRLAREYGNGPVLIADLALEEGIPKKFLELILLELKQQGLLQSKKGKGGGYFLGKRPEEISVGTVLRILDGNLAPVACVGAAHQPCDECRGPKPCSIRLLMGEVHEATTSILDSTTLEQLAKGEDRGNVDPQNLRRYHI